MSNYEWRVIPSVPHYLASREGHVKHIRADRPRYPFVSAKGYCYVGFRMNGKNHNRTVHTMVAEAFIGPRPEGADIRHLDGNPANNHIENLTYGTKAENMADRERHGRTRRGESNGNARLPDEDADEIRRLYAEKKANQYELAAQFDISQAQVNNIILRKQRVRSSEPSRAY